MSNSVVGEGERDGDGEGEEEREGEREREEDDGGGEDGGEEREAGLMYLFTTGSNSFHPQYQSKEGEGE